MTIYGNMQTHACLELVTSQHLRPNITGTLTFIWTQLVEVVMWQVQYEETIGWGLTL